MEWPKDITCKDCGAQISKLDAFTGPRCVECHTRIEDKRPLTDAREVVDLIKKSINTQS